MFVPHKLLYILSNQEMKVSITIFVIIYSIYPCQGQNEPAALLISGFEDCLGDCMSQKQSNEKQSDECGNKPNITQLTSVELFGCPPGQTYASVANIPRAMLQGAAVYWPEYHSVLACGGLLCYEGEHSLTGPTDECHFWNPVQNLWLPTDYLDRDRANFLMTLIDDPSGQNPYQIPYAVGGYSFVDQLILQSYPVYETEYLNPNGWQQSVDYPDLRRTHWPLVAGDGCLVRIDDFIYEVGRDENYNDRVFKVDLTDGSSIDLGVEVDWEGCFDHCQCVPFNIEGHEGIFLSVGNWLNLTDLTWTDFTPLAPEPEIDTNWYKLISFRGVPTGFNFNPHFPHISGHQVMSFDVATDSWYNIGNLTTARTAAAIIEVPGEFCDFMAV